MLIKSNVTFNNRSDCHRQIFSANVLSHLMTDNSARLGFDAFPISPKAISNLADHTRMRHVTHRISGTNNFNQALLARPTIQLTLLKLGGFLILSASIQYANHFHFSAAITQKYFLKLLRHEIIRDYLSDIEQETQNKANRWRGNVTSRRQRPQAVKGRFVIT
jgi:hypothetical protein